MKMSTRVRQFCFMTCYIPQAPGTYVFGRSRNRTAQNMQMSTIHMYTAVCGIILNDHTLIKAGGYFFVISRFSISYQVLYRK